MSIYKFSLKNAAKIYMHTHSPHFGTCSVAYRFTFNARLHPLKCRWPFCIFVKASHSVTRCSCFLVFVFAHKTNLHYLRPDNDALLLLWVSTGFGGQNEELKVNLHQTNFSTFNTFECVYTHTRTHTWLLCVFSFHRVAYFQALLFSNPHIFAGAQLNPHCD